MVRWRAAEVSSVVSGVDQSAQGHQWKYLEIAAGSQKGFVYVGTVCLSGVCVCTVNYFKHSCPYFKL